MKFDINLIPKDQLIAIKINFESYTRGARDALSLIQVMITENEKFLEDLQKRITKELAEN